jgi:hypothetical protein
MAAASGASVVAVPKSPLELHPMAKTTAAISSGLRDTKRPDMKRHSGRPKLGGRTTLHALR